MQSERIRHDATSLRARQQNLQEKTVNMNIVGFQEKIKRFCISF